MEGEDLRPLLDLLLDTVPAPSYDEGHPLQARVTNLDADSYVGRLALCRVHQGTIRRGQQVAWCRRDGSIENVKVAELYVTEGLRRTAAEEAGPGEVIAIAGIPEITIGETIADPEDPRPLPLIAVEEPALGMTVGINTSPLAGQSGSKLTARHGAATACSRSSWATWPSACSTPSGPTPGRCRAAASCSSRCWWRRCAARASS